MKICLNIRCREQFEPLRATQKYCCVDCGKQQSARNWKSKNKEKLRALSDKWNAENPEKVKANHARQVAKNYVSGRLPNWMYS